MTQCHKRRVAMLAAALLLGAAGLAGCGGNDDVPAEVVLVTHDSFAVSKDVKAAFEQESGLKLKLLQGGDAGEALNRALLTAGDPQGDVLFGVDDNLLSRALAGDLFDAYSSPELDAVDPDFTPPTTGSPRSTTARSASTTTGRGSGSAASRRRDSLDDLLLHRYRNLLVVENPATSSPGLAFLLATIARYGDDRWQTYWRGLRANGVRVVDGWEEAYTQQFSGAAGSPGKRPIVVSYATSPAAEVIYASKPLTAAPTAVVEDGCFRQIEYAGVLRGARNPAGAKKLIDFMLSERFQADVPGSMFVYPVRDGVTLPEAFRKFAIQPQQPLTLPPEDIAAHRDDWVDEWTRIVLR